jgi:SSS family transporter
LGRDIAAIAVVMVLTLIYTFEGGMTAVIWTDVVQLGLYVTGALLALGVLMHAVPGGWSGVAQIAGAAGTFRVFDMGWHWTAPYTIWSGVIGGAFLTLGSHGTDQIIVLRLLAARSERQSKLALVSSGFAVFVLMLLFLLIGAGLFAYYRIFPLGMSAVRGDAIFPTFIATRMPHVLAGLLISAILAAAMSNLSAALNSLSSTTVVDFYARFAPQVTEERRLRVSRMSTLVWAVVLFALAILARRGGTVLEMGLSIASVAYGSLLGVFLLGVLTRRATQGGAMVGMACGFALNMYCWLGTRIPYTWYVVLGSAATFAVGYAASWIPAAWARPREMGSAHE